MKAVQAGGAEALMNTGCGLSLRPPNSALAQPHLQLPRPTLTAKFPLGWRPIGRQR